MCRLHLHCVGFKMAKFILLRVAAACEAQEGRFYSKKKITQHQERQTVHRLHHIIYKAVCFL